LDRRKRGQYHMGFHGQWRIQPHHHDQWFRRDYFHLGRWTKYGPEQPDLEWPDDTRATRHADNIRQYEFCRHQQCRFWSDTRPGWNHDPVRHSEWVGIIVADGHGYLAPQPG